MPKEDEHVLVYNDERYCETIYTAKLYLDSWHCVCDCHDGSTLFYVTHWMPLPETPKINMNYDQKFYVKEEEMIKWCEENNYYYKKEEGIFTIYRNKYDCKKCLNNYSEEDCKKLCRDKND